MDVSGILKKIEQDARAAADAAIQEARQRAEEMRQSNQAQLSAQRLAMEEKAKADCAELESRLSRMAELEEKKELLAMRRAAMDEAFVQAEQKLKTAQGSVKRAFFLRELLSAAQGGEALCIGREQRDWFDDAFLSQANQALKEKGKAAPLTLGEDVPGCGFELRLDGAALNCTFEALVQEQRMALEGDVARTMFAE